MKLMLQFLIDNLFVRFGGRLFSKQSAFLQVPNLLLYLQDPNFIPELLKKNKKKLTRSFNFKLRYIDGVLSLNSSTFGDNNPIELDINHDIHTGRSFDSYTSKLIVKKDNLRIFHWYTFHLYTTTFQLHLHMPLNTGISLS